MRHELKCWPSFFSPVVAGYKTFEVRVNDRNYQVNDVLWLREYVASTGQYTGKSAHVRITYITGCLGVIPTGYNLVVMSIVPCDSNGE